MLRIKIINGSPDSYLLGDEGPLTMEQLQERLEVSYGKVEYGPADLVFDVAEYDGEVMMVLGTNYGVHDDSLGCHNVYGLPEQYASEEMEAHWSSGLSVQDTIDEMLASGFTRQEFLAED